MRKVKYDGFKKEIIERNSHLPKAGLSRSIRTKPRAPEELQLLIQHAFIRKEEALASNEYERLAPRRWRVNGVKDPN